MAPVVRPRSLVAARELEGAQALPVLLVVHQGQQPAREPPLAEQGVVRADGARLGGGQVHRFFWVVVHVLLCVASPGLNLLCLSAGKVLCDDRETMKTTDTSAAVVTRHSFYRQILGLEPRMSDGDLSAVQCGICELQEAQKLASFGGTSPNSEQVDRFTSGLSPVPLDESRSPLRDLSAFIGSEGQLLIGQSAQEWFERTREFLAAQQAANARLLDAYNQAVGELGGYDHDFTEQEFEFLRAIDTAEWTPEAVAVHQDGVARVALLKELAVAAEAYWVELKFEKRRAS